MSSDIEEKKNSDFEFIFEHVVSCHALQNADVLLKKYGPDAVAFFAINTLQNRAYSLASGDINENFLKLCIKIVNSKNFGFNVGFFKASNKTVSSLHNLASHLLSEGTFRAQYNALLEAIGKVDVDPQLDEVLDHTPLLSL